MKSLAIALCVLASCRSSALPSAANASTPDARAVRDTEMRSYWFVLLRRGPAWTAESTPESEKLSEGHLANIRAMAEAEKLVLAGPFLDQKGPDRPAGIFIFDVETEDEVRALLDNDPAIRARRFTPEILKWMGPKGLRLILPLTIVPTRAA